MQGKQTIAKQGSEGSFHHETAQQHFSHHELDFVACGTFDELASAQIDHAVMAIENNIARTILQNDGILREHNLYTKGEISIRIVHNLYAYHGVNVGEIQKVTSHPYPVKGSLREYFFHVDIEYADSMVFDKVMEEIRSKVDPVRALDQYQRRDLDSLISKTKDND